ncbi:MAG: hypothetical protein HC860_25685 [Alkalinema sp. RU_4_3]|nr:hypothetical protein [Alkalinema sp. RU_4_3]
MSHPTLDREDIAQRGHQIYDLTLRTQVETTENIGQIIAIDLNTSEYEIDPDLLIACNRLKARHPNTITWAGRIGYDAVYAIGGTITRTAP